MTRDTEVELSTCDRPRCTDAVSEIYIIFPSGATTKIKPSNVWKEREITVLGTI